LQVIQVEAEPWQVKQFELHGKHLSKEAKYPSEQAFTQVEPYRRVGELQEIQFEAVPEHVKQFESHFWHDPCELK